MLEHLRAPFKRLIEPFAKALVSLGLTANAVTVIGAIGTIVVAFATGITGWLFAGAVVLTLLVLAALWLREPLGKRAFIGVVLTFSGIACMLLGRAMP